VTSEKVWSEAGRRSRGEGNGARERGKRGREGEAAAFPKGRERATEIVTVVKRRLEVTTVREQDGRREWSKTASEVFLLAGARRGDYIQVCCASGAEEKERGTEEILLDRFHVQDVGRVDHEGEG